MNLTAAAIIAQTITFVALVTAAVWYAAPWMKHHSLATALTAPLWVHAFRQIAMQIFSARKFGFDVPLTLAREIAWGDVAGALLALTALWLLRHRSHWARVVLWIFVVETVVDLVNATIQGIRNEVFTTANGVTWVILNFYVPLLWVTTALIAWRLTSPAEVPDSSIWPDATLNADVATYRRPRARRSDWASTDKRRSTEMAQFPAPTEGIALTHFIVSRDVERSRHFYTEVLGGEAVLEGELSIVALANGWVTISVAGGPTDDKPTVTLVPPSDPDHASSFLNIRVADINAVYEQWSARGAEFLTPPIDRGSEIRCYMRDPDGHLIEVGQLVGRADS